MRTILVALLSFCAAAPAAAQVTGSAPTTTTPLTRVIARTATHPITNKTEPDNEPPDAPPTVDDHNDSPASISYVHGYKPDHWKRAGLDDRISVHVNQFSTLLKKANGDCAQIVLFIDGLPIKGLKPESCDPAMGHVRYRLIRTQDADSAWHALLGSPHGYVHEVRVTVGSDPQTTVANQADMELEVIPRPQFFAFLVLLAAMVTLFIILCRRTSLIRSGGPSISPSQRPYSLSLFQMAFWFFIVVAAYTFLWLITDELDTITESVLALIGIGAATALGATLIDQNKTAAPVKGTSEGFLRDILSDSAGVSLHRFQMFVWTLVLGVIFIASVYKNLEMPEFSATLLGLMGISSGTYLGFKVPEKTATDAPAGTVEPPAPSS
jgi:uncharacterized membrane protein YeiH